MCDQSEDSKSKVDFCNEDDSDDKYVITSLCSFCLRHFDIVLRYVTLHFYAFYL